jgi:hypothetical protein
MKKEYYYVSNKIFIAVIVLIVGSTAVWIGVNGSDSNKAPRPGVAQQDKGRGHVELEAAASGNDAPPTSGDHANALPWQVYDQEIPDGNAIHNLEHGGVYISYRPDLPQDQIQKITALFGPPYSREKFTPSKAIVAPRAANSSPIIMSSWNRNLKLESFDEEQMVNYYLNNIGKSPEPTAS